jgi:hypothetical protein
VNYVALAVIVLATAVGYYVSCWIWPYAPCRKCKGTGRLSAPFGRAFRNCPRCGGRGRRARPGSRIIE